MSVPHLVWVFGPRAMLSMRCGLFCAQVNRSSGHWIGQNVYPLRPANGATVGDVAIIVPLAVMVSRRTEPSASMVTSCGSPFLLWQCSSALSVVYVLRSWIDAFGSIRDTEGNAEVLNFGVN
jgi:hypothetical protein